MRMKHGSDRGPTISMKPRLLAAFTAVAMMFATAVPALMPRTAVADGPTDLGPTDSGFYKPGYIHLGDDTDRLDEDHGVATWVGRDMYIGGRPAGSDLVLNGNKSGDADGRGLYTYTKAPTGSYAAEAEGLTIVKGKLAINQIKDSWSTSVWNTKGDRTHFSGGQGFRFGIAGFGAQFRPPSGSTALVVAGEGSNISSMTTGGKTGNVGAWNHNGWIGVTSIWGPAQKPPTDVNTWTPVSGEASYKARLTGNATYSQAYVDGYNPKIGNFPGTSKKGDRDSIGGNQGAWAGDDLVTWNAPNPLNVNGTDRSGYTEKIKSDSTTLQGLESTGKVTVGTAPAESATYYRYSYNNNGISYSFDWPNQGQASEKLITFKGDGTSNLQVFNIKNTDLTNGNQAGIDFKFTDIPEGASIVINVTGGDVQFNTGWRFWWGDKQIGNGYYLKGDADVQKAYVDAARSIMWNFADANLVTINGGQYYAGTGGGAGKDDGGKPQDWGYLACGTGQESNFNRGCAGDDPAAAMLGSIMVPNGSFDSHVTTNGRVWVGEDFMMNNPKTAAYFNKIEGVTSSVLDMDQERHNLPWSGSVTASASMIQWQKSNGSTLIPGSSWKLYRTLDDAQKQQNPITTVTDNGTGDWNTTAGIISVKSLVPNKNYYIRENGHMQGYEPNNNIYLIQTTNTGDTLNTTIAKVWNDNRDNITGTADAALTTGGAIINTPEDQGTNIEWGKYAAGDTAHTPLPGSSWDFSSDGGTTWTEITDVTDSVTGIVIKNAQGADVTNTNIGTVQTPGTLKFTASVTPTGAPRGIIWTSSNAAMAVVEPDGTVNVRDGDGSTVVTLTATSTSDPTIKATVSFTPSLPDVSSIEIPNDSPSSTLQDADSRVGLFKLENLPDGEYKLKEHTAPEGFTLNSQVYTITIAKGTVTWNPNHVSDGIAWISDTPTEVGWNKVDAQNTKQPLGGAVWKLESFSNGGYAEYNGEGKGTVTDCTGNCPADPNNPLQDINSDEGMIKLQRLPRGYYRIQEKTPPSGYDAPKNTYYYFELTATPAGPVKIYKGSGSFNTTTGAPTGEGVVEVSYNNITNPRKTGTVYWGKVSTQLEDGKHVYLAGSAWSIKFKPYGAENFQDPVTITDCVRTSESTSGTCSASGSDTWAKDDNIAAGRISLSGLPWGTYEMVEAKAPDGYYGDPSVTYIFTVGPDTPEFQNVQIYVKNNEGKPGAPITTPQNPMGPDGKPLPEYPNQVVENTPGVVLPATGGEGNTLIVLFGFALIAISMLGCGVAMRKRI